MIFAISLGIMLLAAYQVNNVRDTCGGSVSLSSTGTGVNMGNGEPVPDFSSSTTCEPRSNLQRGNYKVNFTPHFYYIMTQTKNK